MVETEGTLLVFTSYIHPQSGFIPLARGSQAALEKECAVDVVAGVILASEGLEGIGTLVSILAGTAGAVTGALATLLARRYRIKSDNALTHQQQLFAQYHRLVEELRQQVAELQGQVGKLQQHYMECRIENAAFQSRIAVLELQISHLSGLPESGRQESRLGERPA
jgi:hypothetical protein